MASKENPKNKGANKCTNKSLENNNKSLNISEQSQAKDMTVDKKLYLLLQVVKELDTKIQEQDIQLRQKEKRVSLQDVSALPSAQSSP